MKTVVIVGSILSCFLLLMISCVNSIEYQNESKLCETLEKKFWNFLDFASSIIEQEPIIGKIYTLIAIIICYFAIVIGCEWPNDTSGTLIPT